MTDPFDVMAATADEIEVRRRHLHSQMAVLSNEVRRRNRVYRAAHAIPDCSEQHIPGECCMDMECPVHGVME